jgi:putative cardiolipin synthase
MWSGDHVSHLLFEALWQAAQRGVRVRLLLDDLNTSSALDATITALAAHPNIEVRLYNLRSPSELPVRSTWSPTLRA